MKTSPVIKPANKKVQNSKASKKQTKEQSRRELSAGGLVFKVTKKGVFFAMIVDSYDKKTFTKGHVQKGERLIEAARRETCEEIGICELEHVAKLGRIDIWFRDRFKFKGALIHKYIHYFLFEADTTARIKIPAPKKRGEKIQKGMWVPTDKVLNESSYVDMKPMIIKALKIIKRKYPDQYA